jgi:hypothetical protein
MARGKRFNMNVPFDDFALGYALSNVGKFELLEHFARRPPRWGSMKM